MMEAQGRVRPLSFDGGSGSPPIVVSGQTPWRGVPFELHSTQPVEGERDSGPPPGEQSALIVVEGAMEVTLRERDRDVTYRCGPGSFSLHSHEERPLLRRVMGTGKIMAVRIPQQWHSRLLHNGAPVRLRYQAPSPPDETVRALATTMCTEVARGAVTGALFAESVSLALLSYVIERLPPAQMQVRGALSAPQQARIRRYVEERLHEDLSVNELAELCGLRQRHFSTLFRRAFGKTPYRYVIDRRLARGAELLVQSSCDVDEIALRLGFASASHFTAEFKRIYSTTPRRYAREQSIRSTMC